MRLARRLLKPALLAALLAVTSACSQSQVSAAPPPRAAEPSKPSGPRTATPKPPAELRAYCDAASQRRATFKLELPFEVRAASLSARPGYAARALTPAEQAVAGQEQLFLGPDNAVTATDLAGGELRPSQEGGYDVYVRVKSPATVAPRLQRLVGARVAVLVDGRLLSLPSLKSATIPAWPVALNVALPAARSTAARLGPPVDEATLQHLEQPCLSGAGTLCLELAEERLLGRDAPYDAERARALFEAGCRSDIGAACRRAADLASSPEDIAKLLESGCRMNDPEACVRTSARLLHRPAKPDAIEQGRAILKRSCDRGGGAACSALVDELSHDFHGDAAPPPETQRALLSLVEQGCSGGDAEACFSRARLARDGQLAATADDAATKRWLQLGCKLDPTGGSLALEAHLGRGDAAFLSTIKEAGCTGEPAAHAPHVPLCG